MCSWFPESCEMKVDFLSYEYSHGNVSCRIKEEKHEDGPIHPLFRKIGRILQKIQFILEDMIGIMSYNEILNTAINIYSH